MKRTYFNSSFPHLIHGADYNPEQWIHDKSVWDRDMELMLQANCNEMNVGIFSWSMLEPREGEYDFSFLDEIIGKIYNAGGRVILATPSGARPRYLAEKYPEVLRWNKNLEPMHYSCRHNHCYTSKVYREKVAKINGLLAQRYGDHPAVLAWHISNEYGGTCYCPKCQNAFRDYLREKYDNDITKLNRAYWSTFWSHTFDSFEQVEPPTSLTDKEMHGLNLDWHRFVSHQTLDFMRAEIAAIRQFCPDLPVTTNMMPAFYDLDYNTFADSLDVISWDSYPDWHSDDQCGVAQNTGFWHDFFRSLKKKPFLMMESAPGLVNWKPVNKLKRPGMDKLAALQAVAHGSDSVQYFQWRKSRGSVEKFHGAVVDHVGTAETRVFKAVQDTGALLKTIDEVAGSGVRSRVAVVFDWENWWALDDAQGFKKDRKYKETCQDYYRYFWNRGISVDVVGVNADWSEYDLVIAPMLYMVSEATAEKIRTYVENGGTCYATYTLGMVNETDLCYLGGFPGSGLNEVFGIWNEEIDTLYDNERVKISGFGLEFEGKDFCELIHLRGAKALAHYDSEFYAGMSALTQNVYGKGKAYYQAFRDTGALRDVVLTRITRELGITGVLAQPVEGVSAHMRFAEGNRYLFVENYSDTQKENIPLPGVFTDMQTGEETSSVTMEPYSIRVFKRIDG